MEEDTSIFLLICSSSSISSPASPPPLLPLLLSWVYLSELFTNHPIILLQTDHLGSPTLTPPSYMPPLCPHCAPTVHPAGPVGRPLRWCSQRPPPPRWDISMNRFSTRGEPQGRGGLQEDYSRTTLGLQEDYRRTTVGLQEGRTTGGVQ